MPPLGVRLTVDVQAREGARGTTYYARVRWTHPVKHSKLWDSAPDWGPGGS
jgi:hypothetical protein